VAALGAGIARPVFKGFGGIRCIRLRAMLPVQGQKYQPFRKPALGDGGFAP